jgi:FkbM family methyltransferase
LLAIKVLPTAASLFEKLPRTLRRHRLMTWWMRITGEDSLQLVRIRDDAKGYADLSDGFLRLIVIDGNYESDFFRIADALLQSGGEFLDVGANHGLLSFGLARKFGKRVTFHLFEPNAKLLESIERTIKLYPTMQAEIVGMAVSDLNGTIQFQVENEQTGASHITESGGTSVRTIKLDTYIEEKRLNQVALLKLDIEGYELKALQGAKNAFRARRISAVYFEYFEKFLIRVAPPPKLIEYLDSLSYEVCFCRISDLNRYQESSTMTLRGGLPGSGLPLIPIRGRPVPAMTDLIAVPKENLVALG